METFGAWCWINFLRLIKQQNLNSQKVNGVGIYLGRNTQVIREDNIQGLDGYVDIGANDNVRTLGLQNFYGHVWNFLSNVIVRSASKVLIKKDFTNADTWPTYSNAVPSGWEELSISLPGIATNNWVSEISWNSNEPWYLYPSKYGGNDVEPIGDTCWNTVNNPFSVVIVGNGTGRGTSGGALYWDSGSPLSLVNMIAGGRSLEIIL